MWLLSSLMILATTWKPSLFSFQHQIIPYDYRPGFETNLWKFEWQSHCYSGKFCSGCLGLIILLNLRRICNDSKQIQGEATRALRDIMFGPEICQNLDCPFQIPTCMNNRLAEKLQKGVFFMKLSLYSLFNTKLYHMI